MANHNAENIKFRVIVPAAGTGSRIGAAIPKQYMPLGGKALLRRTLENIMAWPGIQSVHVVIHPDHADMYAQCVTGLSLPAPVIGGKERNASVFNALKSLENIAGGEDIILIHDAARPFVQWGNVYDLLLTLKNGKARAATLAAAITDTVRRSDNDQTTTETVDRNNLWSIQTPQGFYFSDILKAHKYADDNTLDGITDDTMLISAMGGTVKITPASRRNIKITTNEDWKMAENAIMTTCTHETRTGTGFDVHAFESGETGRKLVLCGVLIPEAPRALAGHSDADVGLHALTDALLGAMGRGDIGLHFPPSDMAYKDMDSRIFVDKTVDMLRDIGGKIINVDITLICEEPKITPYRAAMIEKLAEILDIETGRVNIKATTTEKLGFTGRKEGIAAQAVATIAMPACA